MGLEFSLKLSAEAQGMALYVEQAGSTKNFMFPKTGDMQGFLRWVSQEMENVQFDLLWEASPFGERVEEKRGTPRQPSGEHHKVVLVHEGLGDLESCNFFKFEVFGESQRLKAFAKAFVNLAVRDFGRAFQAPVASYVAFLSEGEVRAWNGERYLYVQEGEVPANVTRQLEELLK